MPQTPHIEKHFTSSEIVRDVVIGMSDGLTVPFALAAGLSGAVASTGIVVTAGLAEVAAGSVAMGLGGYLAARGDAEHYAGERRREAQEVREIPEREAQEVAEVLQQYGLTGEESAPVVDALRKKPEAWIDFMMRFELGLEEPHPGRAMKSAATIGGAYIVGGLIPLLPYMLLHDGRTALLLSVVTTLFALFVFGYIKGRFTGMSSIRSALQTVLIGGLRRRGICDRETDCMSKHQVSTIAHNTGLRPGKHPFPDSQRAVITCCVTGTEIAINQATPGHPRSGLLQYHSSNVRHGHPCKRRLWRHLFLGRRAKPRSAPLPGCDRPNRPSLQISR